jgi:hypothetical protein
MNDNLTISRHLSAVLRDWQSSHDEFPRNVYPRSYWPIPFFGNPATAIVATVGVNPSSGEFQPDRNWNTVQNAVDWKRRLKNYFNQSTPPHEWFAPWQAGFALLGLNYEDGAAAHFDVSYRPTKAMLRNKTTNPKEFRQMIERDSAWLFHLLPLCPRLRGLLVFGPVVRCNGSTESLAGFIRKSAPRHGFSVLPDGGLRVAAPGETGRSFFVHEVCASGRGTITEQVVANLRSHRVALRGQIEAIA